MTKQDIRNEHDANLALQPVAKPAWQQPSRCVRPAPASKSFLARLLGK